MMLDQNPCGQFVHDHHGRHEREAVSFSRDEAKHRHVVDFRKNDRRDVRRFE